MSHVPHDAIVGGVENVVQGHGQFHHAQTGCKVAGVVGQFVYDKSPQFVADLGQLLHGEAPQVGGKFNLRQQRVCLFFGHFNVFVGRNYNIFAR